MKLLPRQLYSKLAVVFVTLLVVLAGVQVLVLGRTWAGIARAADQILHKDLSFQLAEQLQPLLIGPIDYQRLNKRLFELKQILPRVDIFVLDAKGHIKAHWGSSEGIKRTTVNLEPLRKALDFANHNSSTLLGDVPTSNTEQAVFSAAPVVVAGETGYIYSVLSSQQNEIATALAREDFFLRSGSLMLLLTLVGAGVFGLVAFFLLTTRLRELSKTVVGFGSGNLDARLEVKGDDEIAGVASVFNEMATTIVDNIKTLENTDRSRRELIATIYHDLSNPLTSLQLNLELLDELDRENLETQTPKVVQTALGNVHYMEALISDLFELSKFEAKEIPFEPVVVSGKKLLRNLVDSFQLSADRAKIELRLVTDLANDSSSKTEETDEQVWADPVLLNRALANLLNNAIKHTPPGGFVELRLTRSSSNLLFEIADSGSGVSENERKHLFDRFYRTYESRKTAVKGSGLGLTIVREILLLHNSDIALKDNVLNEETSIPGKAQGTVFYFSLQSYKEKSNPEIQADTLASH